MNNGITPTPADIERLRRARLDNPSPVTKRELWEAEAKVLLVTLAGYVAAGRRLLVVGSTDHDRLVASCRQAGTTLAWNSWLIGEGSGCYYKYAQLMAVTSTSTDIVDVEDDPIHAAAFGRGPQSRGLTIAPCTIQEAVDFVLARHVGGPLSYNPFLVI